MAEDGCRSVRMGADERINKERGKDKEKGAPNGRAGHVLGRILNVKKYVMLTKMVFARREDQGQE